MKKHSDLESVIEEPEDHYDDHAEKISIKVFERRNTIKNLQTDENSSSEEEVKKPLQSLNKQPVLNLDKVVEAFEAIPDGLLVPFDSPNPSKSTENIEFESSDIELPVEFEEELPFKLSVHPASNIEEDFLEKLSESRNFSSAKRSPSKKEEDQILREIIQELDRLSGLQSSEELNISKRKMTLKKLESCKKELNEQAGLYSQDIQYFSKEKVNQKVKFFDRSHQVSIKITEKSEERRLLEQHFNVCSRFYEKKLHGMRRVEENLAMNFEDLLVSLSLIKDFNVSFRSSQKKLKRINKIMNSLEEQREKNEFLIQSYSIVLKGISKHMENRENIDFSKRVAEINIKIQQLQTSIDEFTKEALEDPRKIIPYIRSATPNKTRRQS